jgi:multiubiquitin
MAENQDKKKFNFFVDGQIHETEQQSISGADVKRIAGIDPTYQVFLEEEGDTPDKPIPDSQGVDLEGKPKHFFAVPPATFGNR